MEDDRFFYLTAYSLRFIYGGRVNQNDGELLEAQIQQNIDLDEVYVLSLPAFAWFRADYPAKYPRYYHTSVVKAQ